MVFPRLGFFAFIFLAVSFCAGSSFADTAFADWSVGQMFNNLGPYAATVNDSGLVFGEYCYSKTGKCLWLVATSASCESGNHYPVLANTDAGSATLDIICGGEQQLSDKTFYTYTFSDWKSLEGLIKKSSRFGLAVPKEGGQFEVWRFSLNGILAATSAMESAFINSLPKGSPSPQGTLTSTL